MVYINVSVEVDLTTIVACDDVLRRLAEGVEALWPGRGDLIRSKRAEEKKEKISLIWNLWE